MVGIKIRGLTRRFGETLAVDHVDLDIAPGELFFLLGPSGCGKTTLLRMIAGLLEPTSGRIFFDERDVTALPTGRRNTAMVFQGYALWPHMTVAQNVAFGLEVRRVPGAEKRRRVVEVLEIVRLSGLADRRPPELSGGQQQRVALARALVVRPDVLLLDEPLSNLDAALRLEMRSEIRRICRETRVTAVYVTHDQEEALSMADRIALLHEGRIVQIGTPHELYNRPASMFVASFIGQTNFIPGRVEGREGERLIVRSALGPLRAAVFRADVAPGTAVTCCVRPECIRVLGEAHASDAGAARKPAAGWAPARVEAHWAADAGPDVARLGTPGAGQGAAAAGGDAQAAAPPGAQADNVVCAILRDTIYLGHVAHHVATASEDLELRIAELKPPPTRTPGAAVTLGFDAADVIVLEE